MNRQSFAGILLILSAAMLWGTTGTAQSFTPLTLSSYWVGSLRLLVAGVVLCLLSGLSYAVYAMATKHIVATTSPGLATASVFTLAALIALPAAALLAGKPLVSTSDAAVMLWLGVVATGIAYLLFSAGLRWVSSATGVALALAEPIAAVILAVLIVGERPAPISFVGLVLMFAGLSILVRSEISENRPASTGA